MFVLIDKFLKFIVHYIMYLWMKSRSEIRIQYIEFMHYVSWHHQYRN